jgi:uncharacterized protein YkwD
MKYFSLLLLSSLIVSCGKTERSASKKQYQDQVSSSSEVKIPRSFGVKEEYLEILNNHRKNLGLSPLKYLGEIEDEAIDHSQKMAKKLRWFGHLGWRQRCAEIKKRLETGNLCGEIVAHGQQSAHEVFEAWFHSDPHRMVMEGESYTHTGIAYAVDEWGNKYWTQIFLEIPN